MSGLDDRFSAMVRILAGQPEVPLQAPRGRCICAPRQPREDVGLEKFEQASRDAQVWRQLACAWEPAS